MLLEFDSLNFGVVGTDGLIKSVIADVFSCFHEMTNITR